MVFLSCNCTPRAHFHYADTINTQFEPLDWLYLGNITSVKGIELQTLEMEVTLIGGGIQAVHVNFGNRLLEGSC